MELSSGTVQTKNVESFKSLAMTDIKGMKKDSNLLFNLIYYFYLFIYVSQY